MKGSLRLCVNHRNLNTVAIKDPYPIHHMAEGMDVLGRARKFSTLDASSVYRQNEIDESDCEESIFTSHQGLLLFISKPIGLKNAPVMFQRTMNMILATVK